MTNRPTPAAPAGDAKARRHALRFVVLIGVLSLFADFAYEGARSVLGPFLATLGASAAVVGVVTGFGELAGYGLRLVSGRVADLTGRYWPITIAGYVVQMAAVPALALAGSWPAAAALIVLERVGKAIRNPPRDVMLAHAGRRIGGYGWAFGLHEALDQTGAMAGPLVVGAVLAARGDYALAFAALGVPAAITVALVIVTRIAYPRPQDLDVAAAPAPVAGALPKAFYLYLAGAALVAAGFADYPIIAFHFAHEGVASAQAIAVFYAVAMGASGAGSLAFGRLYDRRGFGVIVVLTLVSAAFAPLVFLGGFWTALAGVALWGLAMGVHDSIIPAAVATMVPAPRRATAFGVFTAGYGIAWFAGSALIGFLYDRSLTAAVAFCVVAEVAAVPILVAVGRRLGAGVAAR
jgi:MFS family permease